MLFRIGALLIVTGTTLMALLQGPFVAAGVGCLFFGAIVLAVPMERTLEPSRVTASRQSSTESESALAVPTDQLPAFTHLVALAPLDSLPDERSLTERSAVSA